MRELWEILVPTVRNDGKPYRLRYHKVWDDKVRAISGGLTVMPVAKGQWVYKEELFTERMIPVRILEGPQTYLRGVYSMPIRLSPKEHVCPVNA